MATYYVATTGSNSNSGSILSPWLTLQHAFNNVVAGDTINIRGGTYVGVAQLLTDGSAGSPITVQNYNGETVVLDGNDIEQGGGPFQSYVIDSASNYTIIRCTGAVGTFEVKNSAGHGIRLQNNNNCTIDKLWIHDTIYAGIYGYLSYTNTLTNNLVHNCSKPVGGGDSDGIQMSNNFIRETGAHVIAGNTVHTCSDDGIDVYWMAGCTIRDNIVYNIGPTYAGSDSGNGSGFKIGPGGSNTVYNNRVAFTQGGGIGGNEGPSNLIYNNTVYNAGAGSYWYGIWADASGDGLGCILRNNIGAGTPGGNAFSVPITESHNSWNLSLTPTFVSTDPANANFLKLAAASPGIDVGTDLSGVFTTDAFGTTRTGTWDLGAHEYVGGGGGGPTGKHGSFRRRRR